jgi:hypothetical protein
MIATKIENIDQIRLIDRLGMKIPFDITWWERNLRKGKLYLCVDYDNKLDYVFRFAGEKPIILAFERFLIEIL